MTCVMHKEIIDLCNKAIEEFSRFEETLENGGAVEEAIWNIYELVRRNSYESMGSSTELIH